MKRTPLSLLVLISFLGAVLGPESAKAQGEEPPQPPPAPAERHRPAAGNVVVERQVHVGAAAAQENLGAFTLGTSGLSFRYLQTFGVTDVAYPSDTAHLNYPFGVGTDGDNVWVAELWGNRALKYDGSGAFLQQIGIAGNADSYEDASLSSIADVAVDGSGNIWVVDTDGAHVVKFSSSGAFVSRLGVEGDAGSDDAHFFHPVSIALDASGNIYVSDGKQFWSDPDNNQRIQVFDSGGGYLATIGETGVAGSDNAHFNGPQHIAADGSELFVADHNNNRIQIFDVSTPSAPAHANTIGGGSAGLGDYQFNGPSGVAVDANYIYVSDWGNSRVQVFNRADRTYYETIGSGPGSGNDEFENPFDVAVDASGNVYVADFVNTRAQEFSPSGGTWTYARTLGLTGVPYVTDGYHYNTPSGVAVAGDGSLYVIEDRGHRLVKLSGAGAPIWTVGSPGVKGDWDESNTSLDNPADVALDASGRVYVADRRHGRVQIYDSDSSYVATIGDLGCPGGVGIAPTNGYIYVADNCDSVVRVYDASRVLVASMGVPGEFGSDNAHFNSPEDVAVDGLGMIYVSDASNHRVQVFDASRVYVRTLGVSGFSDSDFGHFSGPDGLFVDSANRLYVADQWNDRVQVFDAAGGYLTTLGGSWGTGTGELQGPGGVAVDSTGAVLVADSLNHRIQKFALGTPNWTQKNINGFGDRWNIETEVLAAFNGQLYAGTSGDVAQIWRTADGQTWSGMVTNGFGEPENTGVTQLIEFGGKLYAGTNNCSERDADFNCTGSNGGQIWRSADGATWNDQVVSGGFGNTDNRAVNAFAVHSGYLYAATSALHEPPEIYRSSSGNSGTWSLVVSDGFGGGVLAWDVVMDVYGGYLYAGVGREGLAALWRTSDGTTWSPVFTDGLGNADNSAVASMAEFNGEFYIGLRNVAEEGGTGSELWKTSNGTTFTKVFDGGLGDADNGRPYGLYVFGGTLYLVFGNFDTGAQVWRTWDGSNWYQVGFAGWGDANNTLADYYDKGAAAFAGRLYIGTYNYGNGGEVWSPTPSAGTFWDVPLPGKEWMEPWIVAFYNAGITTGCGASPLIYCPENNVTRAEMAVFVLRTRHGAGYAPPPASHYFSDVPVSGKEWMEPWIDQYYREGMTAGCGGGNYCPENNVTRAEMAVFVLRALHGGGYAPPAASGVFADVPVAGKEWMEPWIIQFYNEGITTGCGGGNYCPENNVTRAEMAVFIGRAYHLYP